MTGKSLIFFVTIIMAMLSVVIILMPIFTFGFSLFQTSTNAWTILVHQTLIVQTFLDLSNVNVKMDFQEMVSLVMVCLFVMVSFLLVHGLHNTIHHELKSWYCFNIDLFPTRTSRKKSLADIETKLRLYSPKLAAVCNGRWREVVNWTRQEKTWHNSLQTNHELINRL